jgi:ABC-2 type transport system permease protein
MLSSVFSKGMRDQWRSLLVWVVTVAAFALMMTAFYPSVKASMASYQQIADKLPQVLRDAFVGSDIGSPTGWLDTKLFSMMAPIIFLVYAISAGARGIAGEEEQGTLDLLLAQPVSRGRVLLQKYAGMVAGLVLLTATLFGTLVATAPLFQMHIGAWRLLQGSLLVGLLGLAFGSIAFLVAAGWGRRGLAYGVAGGLAGIMYLMDILAPLWTVLERIRPVSLYYYYGIAPLSEGMRVVDVAAFGLTSLVALALAYAAFGRRDIGA